MIRIFLNIFCVLSFVLSAQAAPSLDFIDITQAPADTSCSMVLENDPAYFVTSSGGAGSLPRNTLVQITDPANTTYGPGGIAEVRVVSMPSENPLSEIDNATGAITPPTFNTGVSVGMKTRVQRVDLLAMSASVFVVKRDTPMFNISELRDRPIRLAQNNGQFVTKKCCPVVSADGDKKKKKKHTETKSAMTCQSFPVFEIVGKTSGQYFTTDDCNTFAAGLQPISGGNMRNVMSLRDTLEHYSQQDLTELQKVAYENVLQERCIINTGPGTKRKCIPKSGNGSKGRCRAAVRETLQELGYLPENAVPEPDPNLAAANYSPWLSTQGFEDVTAKYQTTTNAPAGSVLVYSGGAAGHIEIKVDEDSYCSDFCADKPIDLSRLQGQRKLIGIYLPRKK